MLVLARRTFRSPGTWSDSGRRDSRVPLHPPGAEPLTSPSSGTDRWDIARDNIRVTNVTWEAGAKDDSTVTFDLSWANSWRAAWTEPADKNVTGKPLKVESWDAAWVFVKFRRRHGCEEQLVATRDTRPGRLASPRSRWGGPGRRSERRWRQGPRGIYVPLCRRERAGLVQERPVTLAARQ